MEEEEIAQGSNALAIFLPLPYRVLLSAILGVWLFGFNLHYFDVVHIDVSPMLRYTRSSSEPPLHRSVYQVASVLSGVFALNLVTFWVFAGNDIEAVKQWEVLPLMMLVAIVVVFMWPVGGWHQRGRSQFLRMLRRVLIGGLDSDLRFADILLADALTSYAKVLGDLVIIVCMYLSGYSSTNPLPNRLCGGAYLMPCAMALPYLCRLRQCLIEYFRASRKGLPMKERRPHLYNSAKYATAFPVIICSAMQRGYDPAEPHYFSRSALSHAWLVAVVINSSFSFYWDIARDWELTLLSPKRNSPDHPYGLRRNRHFVTKEFYYAAIVIDFLLRGTWSIKLSPHLDHLNEMEGGIFLLELLEIFRRWVWVFFRVEKEYIVTRSGSVLGLLGEEEGMMMNEFED